MPLVIRLAQRGQLFDFAPGYNDEELDESPVLLTFPAATPPVVALDDTSLPVMWRQTGSFAACNFDLTNQVGHHRLSIRIGPQLLNFDFRTSTTKATWDEVRTMAEVCGKNYLTYRRQFTYAAANGERRKVFLPQVHFGWLRDRLPEVAALVRSINARPAMASQRRIQVSARARGMRLPATIRLLHERPYLLEIRDDGPIVVDDIRYWPSLVAVKVLEKEPASREHAEIAGFLLHLLQGCEDLSSQVDTPLREVVKGHSNVVSTLLSLSTFANVRRGGRTSFSANTPTQVQRSDSRYARLRALRVEYFSDIAPTDSYGKSIRANVKDIWEIYQTFVAHVVGNALGMAYCAENCDLRNRAPDGASMRSAEWILGFDAAPPGKVLSSWRERTARPGDERPDISIIGSTADRSLLLDAKFKQDKIASRATQADLFEMQGYMNSFAVARGGIIFPGQEPIANLLEARGNRLLELPVRAAFFAQLGSASAVHSYTRAAIEAAMMPLNS